MAEDGADHFPELRSVYRASGHKRNLSNSRWLESISNGSASRPCQNSAPNAWRNPNVIEKLKLVKRVNGGKGVTNNNHQDKTNSLSPEDETNSLGTLPCIESESEVLNNNNSPPSCIESESEVLNDNNSPPPCIEGESEVLNNNNSPLPCIETESEVFNDNNSPLPCIIESESEVLNDNNSPQSVLTPTLDIRGIDTTASKECKNEQFLETPCENNYENNDEIVETLEEESSLTARGKPDLKFERQNQEMDFQDQIVIQQKLVQIYEEKKLALWQKMVIEFEKMVLQLEKELENELKQHMDLHFQPVTRT